MALTRESPTARKEPGCCAKTKGTVSPNASNDGSNISTVSIARKLAKDRDTAKGEEGEARNMTA